MNWLRSLVVLGLALVLTGCNETFPLAWSPDGSTLAVSATDGLRMSDVKGNLSAPLLPDVRRSMWYPDSQRILAHHVRHLKNWSDAAAVLSKQDQQAAIAFAGELRSAMMAHGDQWDKHFDPEKKSDALPSAVPKAAILYLKEHDFGAISKRVGSTLATAPEITVDEHEIVQISKDDSSKRNTLFKTTSNIGDFRLSPDGRWVLISVQPRDKRPYELVVVPAVRAEAPVVVAKSTSARPDWCADSRHVVYVKSSSHTEDQMFGAVCMLEVIDSEGKIRVNPGSAEDLAYAHIKEDSQVRALKDGAVLYAGVETMLPSTPVDMANSENLFLITSKQHVVRRLMPRRIAADHGHIGFFEPSPDEKWVAVVSEDAKDLTLLEMATGQIKSANALGMTGPAWRNAGELSFLMPLQRVSDSNHAAEVVLYSLGTEKTDILSGSWPESAVKSALIPSDERK